MWRLLQLLARAARRVFLHGTTQAQAVAFNMFLAFFPMMLLALGVLGQLALVGGAAEEMLERLRWLLPPGSRRIVLDSLVEQAASPAWLLLGLGGTLFLGTEVMTGLVNGFRILYGDSNGDHFLKRQMRSLALLLVTIGPFLAAVVLTVFGKQVRNWMAVYFGLPQFFDRLWAVVYVGLALVLTLLVLTLVFRVGCRRSKDWNAVLPGAAVATLLWWIVNTAFGAYVRRMPYGKFYGELGAAIGLIIWMYLSVLIVFLGAAFNAESASAQEAKSPLPPD